VRSSVELCQWRQDVAGCATSLRAVTSFTRVTMTLDYAWRLWKVKEKWELGSLQISWEPVPTSTFR
jgi:hypothetical protein